MTTFEPPGVLNSHSSHAKTRPKGRVYAWLGWRDSNPRMSAPKADALPLGDTPLGVYWMVIQNSTNITRWPQNDHR